MTDGVKCNNKIAYFLVEPDKQAKMKRNAKVAKLVHQEVTMFFSGIGCFKATFSLEVKDGMKPYQAPVRHV